MKCQCSGKHVPKPVSFVELTVNGEQVWLCPTSYCNLMQYQKEWNQHSGRPPGNVRKHYSAYVQELAELVINERSD